ncbi:MAG: pyruvate, phosphate dikinase [Candidatus Aenigmatarchaeota archaeon]|nr:MAG: pyruvate, phosphate dikinase [Candidatus Aenigmarchaeota archaeon]
MERWVYFFGEGDTKDKMLLGGKGANLGEMKKIGLPVPAGFTITTKACNEYYGNNKNWPPGLKEQVMENLKRLEHESGKKFGDPSDPLLVSVRSGAPISMPGMMDTILNLGLNDSSVKGLAKQTANERFAYDSYRRFIQMFGNVVLGIKHELFEEVLDSYKKGRNDTDLSSDELKRVVESYKELIKKETGKEFPQDAMEQLFMAINAVFESWNNKRAITYRKLNKIPDDLGTAVNVQQMVFGNMGWDSGTGVGFTRNPSTGENKLYGEYLLNAQGEDVVAGIRTPKEIEKLKEDMPKVYEELVRIRDILEKHFKDMQDFEFTIERGKLYILQTRNGKRTAQAAVKIAVDMVKEGLISKEEAIMRIEPEHLKQLLHERIDPNAKLNIIAKGLAASPGAASGIVVFDADEAVRLVEQESMDVILVRTETSPEDIHGMAVAKGILTSRGGMTSHAAVVARGMGKCAVVGCESIKIDEKAKRMRIGEIEIKEGEWLTIDGTTGNVILGKVKTIEPSLAGEFKELMEWADSIRRLGIRTNADTPKDAKVARDFGAEGIGLCRTEHMFFEEDRLPIMQSMILSRTKKEREKHLDKLLPIQKKDFIEIFRVMKGLPVTIRLLDPPLHEFLPNYEELLLEIEGMKMMNEDVEKIREKEKMLARVKELREMNPMLGHRGCRLGITFPEIYEMQVKAIIGAACELAKEGVEVKPEIMVPLVSDAEELRILKEIIDSTASNVMEEYGVKVKYSVGTMIEIPRAALTAGEIAKHAAFFSFGTNDLTQMTFAFSRDDAEEKFLNVYIRKKILGSDPFVTIDRDGVGRLMKIAIQEGKKARRELKLGICGEHGGDPQTIEFCNSIGLDYVSCSPYRVPVARLTAAQAVIKQEGVKNG